MPDGAGWELYKPGDNGSSSQPDCPPVSEAKKWEGGPVEIPTKIPKDTMVYPPDFIPNESNTPNNKLCWRNCIARIALGLGAKEGVSHYAAHQFAAAGMSIAARTLTVGGIIVGASSAFFGYDACKAECGE